MRYSINAIALATAASALSTSKLPPVVRLFGLSDLHVDYAANLDTVKILERPPGEGHLALIIAGDVVGEALSGIILNINRGVLDMCAVKAPGFGDVRRAFLDDICTFTGATLITDEIGRRLQDVTIDDLGALDS